MDNKVLNNIKERLLKDNDEYRCRQRTMADRYAAGYANGVEDTLVAVAAAEAAEQQAQSEPAARTNLDRIRAMSAEMLAKWITSLGNIDCTECPAAKVCGTFNGIVCEDVFVKWLNSPAKEENNA